MTEQLGFAVEVGGGGGRGAKAVGTGGVLEVGARWWLLSRGVGQLRLGTQPGAVAVVELDVVPLMLGAVPPPRLTLSGCAVVVSEPHGDSACLTVVP